MEPATLSAVSGLVGSLIGASTSIVAQWVTKRYETHAQAQAREASKHEALYSEFIVEAAKRLADAMTHQAQGPEVLVALYAAIGRMRLMSSRTVIEAAEDVVRRIVDTYSSPNLSFAALREQIQTDFGDPLSEFGEACRLELASLLADTPSQVARPVMHAVHDLMNSHYWPCWHVLRKLTA